MMNPFKTKKGLGRGLSSLIGDNEIRVPKNKISISSIIKNKFQPRKHFEKDARGPYAGVYGSIDINGALNTAITIRTMIVKPSIDGKYDVSVQAGAGIVADSFPENEYQETINKAKGILKALACLDT